jgi:beta-phosphoglucomutase-like phosphatase (HAD superfamily)
VVIEDSWNGVRAGLDAGIPVITVGEEAENIAKKEPRVLASFPGGLLQLVESMGSLGQEEK